MTALIRDAFGVFLSREVFGYFVPGFLFLEAVARLEGNRSFWGVWESATRSWGSIAGVIFAVGVAYGSYICGVVLRLIGTVCGLWVGGGESGLLGCPSNLTRATPAEAFLWSSDIERLKRHYLRADLDMHPARGATRMREVVFLHLTGVAGIGAIILSVRLLVSGLDVASVKSVLAGIGVCFTIPALAPGTNINSRTREWARWIAWGSLVMILLAVRGKISLEGVHQEHGWGLLAIGIILVCGHYRHAQQIAVLGAMKSSAALAESAGGGRRANESRIASRVTLLAAALGALGAVFGDELWGRWIDKPVIERWRGLEVVVGESPALGNVGGFEGNGPGVLTLSSQFALRNTSKYYSVDVTSVCLSVSATGLGRMLEPFGDQNRKCTSLSLAAGERRGVQLERSFQVATAQKGEFLREMQSSGEVEMSMSISYEKNDRKHLAPPVVWRVGLRDLGDPLDASARGRNRPLKISVE